MDFYRGKLNHTISVSQISTFANLHDPTLWAYDACPRRWALQTMAKIDRSTSEALEIGKQVDESIEDHFRMPHQAWCKKWPPEYLKGGPKIGALVQAMLRQLESMAEKPKMQSTWHWELPEIDCAIYVKPDWHCRAHLIFGDWKTTGAENRQGRYVLQQPDFWPIHHVRGERPPKIKMLADDPQALVYALYLMKLWNVKEIRAQWIYASKKFSPGDTPKAWSVREVFTRVETERAFYKKIYPIICLMTRMRKRLQNRNVADAMLLPHNPEACGSIGRNCDGLSHCEFKSSETTLDDLRRVLGK